MSGLWGTLLLSLLPGVGNFLGGVLAEVTKTPARLLNQALHASAGLVVAIVAVELIPEARATLAGGWMALAFATGGVAYVAADALVRRLQSGGADEERRRMWMIYVAVAVDLVSDGMMIGAGAAVSFSLALVLAVGQVLGDLPEGYAVVANFRDKGLARRARLGLSASFILVVVSAACGSYLLLREAPEYWKAAALAFVAGLLLVAAVEDMLEEAHAANADSRRSVLAFVGGFALFVLLSSGMRQALDMG